MFPAYIYTNCNRFLDVGFVRISDDLPYSTNLVPPHSTTLLPHRVAEGSTRNGVAGTLPHPSLSQTAGIPLLSKRHWGIANLICQAVKLQAIAWKAVHPKAARFISYRQGVRADEVPRPGKSRVLRGKEILDEYDNCLVFSPTPQLLFTEIDVSISDRLENTSVSHR